MYSQQQIFLEIAKKNCKISEPISPWWEVKFQGLSLELLATLINFSSLFESFLVICHPLHNFKGKVNPGNLKIIWLIQEILKLFANHHKYFMKQICNISKCKPVFYLVLEKNYQQNILMTDKWRNHNKQIKYKKI